MIERKIFATAMVWFMIASAFFGLVSVQPSVSANSGSSTTCWYYWVDNRDPEPKVTYNWIDISQDGLNATLERGSLDEGYSIPIDIGFPFPFFNVTYTQVRVYTNGFVTFHMNLSTSNYYPNNIAIPNAGNPNNMTAVFWDDLILLPALDAKILYKSDTTSSPKKFIVQYINVTHYSEQSTPMTFEVILYEDGTILYQYETMGPLGATYSTGGYATVGIENGTGNAGVQYSYNTQDKITSGLAVLFTKADHDVGVKSVNNHVVSPGKPINIIANLSNYRPVDEIDVDVFFNITDGAGVEVTSWSTVVPLLTASSYVYVTWSTNAPLSPGMYYINAYSALGTDPILSNNKSVGNLTVKPIYSLPWNEDFESGWTGWHNETYAGSARFSIGTPSSTSAYNGSNCAGFVLSGTYPNYANASIISPIINLTSVSNADLEFWMWASLDDNYDGGIVEISTDDGTTWQQLDPTNAEGNYNGILSTSWGNPLGGKYAFCTDTSSWVKKKFSLDAYCGNTVFLRFTFGSDSSVSGSGWLIDAISVRERASVDVGVTAITGNVSVRVGTQAKFTANVTNFGVAPETFDVFYMVEHPIGTVVYSNTHSVSNLAPATTVSFEFTYTPTETGLYYVTAYSTLPTDTNPTNNASYFSLTSVGVYSIPYFTDFSGDNSNWTTPGISSWQFGIPTGTITPIDGPCAGYNLTTNYPNSANVSLISPYFDLTTVSNAYLKFQMCADFEGTASRYDGGIIEVSIDDGATWQQLDPTNAQGQYDNTISSGSNVLNGKYAFCYDTSGWVQKKFDLSSYFGYVIQLRFRLGSDSSGSGRGWFIDNVTVDVPQPVELNVTSIDIGSASGFIPTGVEIPMLVSVSNSVSEPGTFNLVLNVTNSMGVVVWSETKMNLNIDANSQITETFLVNIPTTTTPGLYTIGAYANHPADPVQSNNVKTTPIYIMHKYNPPYFDDFETLNNDWIAFGANGTWQIGAPTGYSPYSGTQCAGYNLTGSYRNNADTSLYSSFIDLTQAVNGTLEFYLWADFYGGSADGMLIMISVNYGPWQYLDPTNTQGQYNAAISGTVNPMAGNYAFTSDTSAWIKKTFNLGAFIGSMIQFRFRFASNAADVSVGTYIDDINITIPTGADVKVESVTGEKVIVVNKTTTVYATIKNVGAEPCTVLVNLTATNTTSGTTIFLSESVYMPLFGLVDVPFVFSAPMAGYYLLTVSADLSTDMNLSDNIWLGIFYALPIYTIPFSDNFETEKGWCTSPWENGWAIGIPGWSTPLWGNSAGYNLTNGNYRNRADVKLYSPAINLSGGSALYLSFLSRMNVYGSYQDGGIVEVSVDYGKSWMQLDSTNASGQYDGIITSASSNISGCYAFCLDSAWKKKTFDISMYIGLEIVLRFRFVSDSSYYSTGGWLIDNVTILPPEKEVGVISVSSPNFVKSGTQFFVNATVVNNGYATQTFNLVLNATNQYTHNWTLFTIQVENLAFQEIRECPFTVTLTEFGEYGLNVEAVLPGDEEPTNNFGWSSTMLMLVYLAPYYEPFNTPTVPYYHLGYQDTWGYGIPNASLGITPHTGIYCLATNLSGNYASNEYSIVLMPYVDLSGMTSANLTFWMYGDFEGTTSNYDGGIVVISTDGGDTWEQLDATNSQGNYNANISTSYGNPLGGKYAFCYDTNGWVQKKFNLDVYCGEEILIAFLFGADNIGVAKGWYIDDIKIATQPAFDIGINKTTIPSRIDCFVDVANITAQIINYGYGEVAGYTITAKIIASNGTVMYSETQTYTEQFTPGAESFHNWLWRPLEGGNYTVNITLILASDEDMSNNYFEKTFSVDPAIPLNINEEGLGNITSTDKSTVYVVNGLVSTEKYYILAAYTYALSTYRRPMVSIYSNSFELITSNGSWFAYTPTYNGTYYFKLSNRTTELGAFTFIVATRSGLKDLYAGGLGYIIDNCTKTIDPANFYIVSLSSGITYTITPEETDSDADVVAYFIYESNMTYFASRDYTSLVITPPEDLMLIIIVVPYGSTYPDGMYNISISPLPGEVQTLSALLDINVASINPGQTANFAITLSATGSSPIDVNIGLQNIPASWSYTISENTVSVTPGTPYIVYVNVTPSTNALADNYILNIMVTSAIASYMFTPTVTVLPVHSLSVNFAQSSITAQPGSSVTFDVEITSASNVNENVILSANVPSSWISTINPSNQISLSPFGTTQVQITITIPANALAGSKIVWLNATYSGNQASANAQVVVSAIYGLELSIESGKSILPGQTLIYNFTLNSTANADDTVALTLDLPPSWTISTLTTPITIPLGSQTYSGSFIINVPLNAAPGTYTITLHAISQGNTSIEVTASVSTVVNSLYGVSITTSPSQMAEPGSTVIYTINITSNWADTILITTEGLEAWMPALSTSQVSFESPGTVSVYLTLTAPMTVTQGNYNIVVNAVSQNQSSANASITVTTMVIISPYGVSISQPVNQTTSAGVAVSYTFSVSSTTADTIIITTSGLSSWSPSLSTTRLTFAEAGTQTVTLILTPPTNAEGTYDITVTARSENNTAKFASVTVCTTVTPAAQPRYDIELTIGTLTYTLTPTTTEELPIILNLKNNGTVLDNITVTISGLPAGWSALTRNLELAAGESGTLTIVVTIPENAVAGVTTLTFVATSLNVSEKDSKSVSITITRPDLSISSVTITPSTPKVGDTVTFTIVVSNSGTGVATNVNVTIYVDGSPVVTKQITSLDAGQQTTLTHIYTFSKDGTHVVKAVVDVEGKVIEINDMNNEGMNTISVKKKAQPTKTILGLEESLAYLLIALVIAVVLILIAVMYIMRRKKPPVESSTINLEGEQAEKPAEQSIDQSVEQQVVEGDAQAPQDANLPGEQTAQPQEGNVSENPQTQENIEQHDQSDQASSTDMPAQPPTQQPPQ